MHEYENKVGQPSVDTDLFLVEVDSFLVEVVQVGYAIPTSVSFSLYCCLIVSVDTS